MTITVTASAVLRVRYALTAINLYMNNRFSFTPLQRRNDMSEYTREPWIVNEDAVGDVFISGADDKWICEIGNPDCDGGMEDARRIVACVNACAGIDTETLETRIKYTFTDIEKRNKELEAQLAERDTEIERLRSKYRAQLLDLRDDFQTSEPVHNRIQYMVETLGVKRHE
jgi:hypothetical protein